MARYINKDEFVAWAKEHWCADCQNDNGLRCRVCLIDYAIYIVEEAPEADVAPKSEVENLKALLEMNEKAYDSLRELYKTDTDAFVEARRKTGGEVAREIFDEIEKVSCRISESDPNGFLRVVCYQLSAEKFDELKKKYTEETK